MSNIKYYIFPVLLLFLLAGCANRVTPLGGEKDVKPPVIINVSPPSGKTNLLTGNIIITFDEYVQLKDGPKQIFISPLMSPAPKMLIRKKNIIINLPDSLKSNLVKSANRDGP